MDNGSVAALDAELRGMLVSLAVLGADPSVCADLDEPRRVSLRQAWQDLQAMDEATRDRTLSACRQEAVSTDLARLHPSWIDEELAGERPGLAAAIRGALAAGAKVDGRARELARLALARCVALCDSEAGPLAGELSALSLDELLDDITRRGARAVGRSLGGAPPAVRARAMAAVGEPWAQEIAAGARQVLSPAERAAALGLAGRAGTSAGTTVRERLLAVGLAALKDELAAEGAGSALRVAGRLPATLGRALLGW